MKLFILAVVFVACLVSAEAADNTASGQLVKQIQCYLQKLKAKLPANAVAQDEALIKDAQAVEDANNGLSEKGIARSLRDASNQLTTVLPKLKDQKLRALATEMLAKLKAAATKFESGNGDFKDLFTLNTNIRNSLEQNFGGGCGKSTLPEGVSSSDQAKENIEKYVGKIKAWAPASARPLFDQLIEDTEAVQKASQEFDRKKLIAVLKKNINDSKKLIATVKDEKSAPYQHQAQILTKLEALVKKFESGKGTYLDLYKDYYQYIEQRLAMDA